MIYDHEYNGAEVQGNFGDVSLSFPMSRRTVFRSVPPHLRPVPTPPNALPRPLLIQYRLPPPRPPRFYCRFWGSSLDLLFHNHPSATCHYSLDQSTSPKDR